MPKEQTTLIIGYGNPLRQDDGLGQVVAERLQAVDWASSVAVMAVHQLTIDLAEEASQVDRLILIDAAQGDPPAALSVETIQADQAAFDPFSHYVTPSALLAATAAIYGRTPVCTLLTINALSLEIGEGLSPVVAARLPELLEQVKALVDAS
ncbi:MAG: hydrogenase maturation protease [Chloroflexi bacterium]|nr:hydrogenase maturation protease [Chloroflexota bacterium]